MNVSVSRSGSSTNLNIILHAHDEQKGNLTLAVSCQPSLSVNASVQHSIEAIQTLGFPRRGSLILHVSAGPHVMVGLELGQCYFNGKLETTKPSGTERNHMSYTVNMTNYCPALQVSQGTIDIRHNLI